MVVTGETAPTAVDALCILRNVVGLPATNVCPHFAASVAAPLAASSASERRTGGGAPPTSGLIQLKPSTLNLSSGKSGEVAVTANVPGGLGSWTVDVTYDPKQIEVTGCDGVSGSLCNATFASGRVRISGAAASGVSGKETLARIQLRGRSGGTARLGLDVLELSDASGASVATTAGGADAPDGP